LLSCKKNETPLSKCTVACACSANNQRLKNIKRRARTPLQNKIGKFSILYAAHKSGKKEKEIFKMWKEWTNKKPTTQKIYFFFG
jgi:hypothetical protein